MKALTKALGLIGVTFAMQGCSLVQMGSDHYSCSGIPDTVTCMSAREVYRMTDNGNVPRDVDKQTAEKNGWIIPGDKNSGSGKQSSDNDKPKTVVNTLVDHYVAPSVPDKPVPIRTPAKVMRIWIAPWVDSNQNLNVSSYVYTEIEKRRWLYDMSGESASMRIQPLQVIKSGAPMLEGGKDSRSTGKASGDDSAKWPGNPGYNPLMHKQGE